MLLPTVRIPTSSFFGLAWDPAMFCVSDSAPKVACSIGLITRADFLLVRVGAAGRAVTIPIPIDVLEFFSIVFLASIRKPTSPIFVGLPRNFSPWCLGDGTPIASVFVFAVRRPPWATRFGVDGDVLKVICAMFLPAVRKPASIAVCLARNAAPLTVCDRAPKTTCTIALKSWSRVVHTAGSDEKLGKHERPKLSLLELK